MASVIRTVSTPSIEEYWLRSQEVTYCKERWLIPFKVTKEVRLHILQWKISHNIYPTSIILSKMGYRQSDKCQSCNMRETLTHFFYDCFTTKQIWSEIEKKISACTGKQIKINSVLALHGFIPGNDMSKKDYTFINQIILIGKLTISKWKYGPKRNPIEILESELRMRKIL